MSKEHGKGYGLVVMIEDQGRVVVADAERIVRVLDNGLMCDCGVSLWDAECAGCAEEERLRVEFAGVDKVYGEGMDSGVDDGKS